MVFGGWGTASSSTVQASISRGFMHCFFVLKFRASLLECPSGTQSQYRGSKYQPNPGLLSTSLQKSSEPGDGCDLLCAQPPAGPQGKLSIIPFHRQKVGLRDQVAAHSHGDARGSDSRILLPDSTPHAPVPSFSEALFL